MRTYTSECRCWHLAFMSMRRRPYLWEVCQRSRQQVSPRISSFRSHSMQACASALDSRCVPRCTPKVRFCDLAASTVCVQRSECRFSPCARCRRSTARPQVAAHYSQYGVPVGQGLHDDVLYRALCSSLLSPYVLMWCVHTGLHVGALGRRVRGLELPLGSFRV